MARTNWKDKYIVEVDCHARDRKLMEDFKEASIYWQGRHEELEKILGDIRSQTSRTVRLAQDEIAWLRERLDKKIKKNA